MAFRESPVRFWVVVRPLPGYFDPTTIALLVQVSEDMRES